MADKPEISEKEKEIRQGVGKAYHWWAHRLRVNKNQGPDVVERRFVKEGRRNTIDD